MKKRLLAEIKQNIWVIALDIIAVNGSYLLALLFRYYLHFRFVSAAEKFLLIYQKFAPFYSVICVVVFALFGLYNGMWRYAGLADMNRIIGASLSASVLYVLGTSIFFERMPITYYTIGTAIQLILIVVIRFSYRLIVFERRKITQKSPNAAVIGIGETGSYVVKLLNEGVAYRPVCMIDTIEAFQGRMINGLPVYSVEQFVEAIDKHNVKGVFIAEKNLNYKVRENIKSICESNNIELRDYSSFFDFTGESDSFTGMQEVITGPKDHKGEGRKAIPFSPPDISEKEIGEVVETLKSGWITTGPRTKLLERRLAAYIETGRTDIDTESEPQRWQNRVVCLNSATAGEELNLRILGIGPGDEVIVPAYTYTASASAVIHCGAKVVFVDIQKDGDPVTHMPEMDYEILEAAITERTKAVIVVDLGGIVADYDRIFEIVERKRTLFKPIESDGSPLGDLSSRIQHAIGRVAVVCDAAHALGASRAVCYTGGGKLEKQKKYVGAIADFTSFSFHAVKNFTTAEGGASTWCLPQSVYDTGVTDAEIYKFYQLLSLHGQNKDALAKSKVGAWEYDIIGPWYKCNMTDIMAAIGLRQLDRYLALLARREEMMVRYNAVCDELGISYMKHHVEGMDSSNHLYLIRVPGVDVEARNLIIEKMAEKGVATNVHYKPMPMMTAYKALGWEIEDFPNTYDYYHNLVTLPFHTLLTDEDVDYVCETLKDVILEMH